MWDIAFRVVNSVYYYLFFKLIEVISRRPWCSQAANELKADTGFSTTKSGARVIGWIYKENGERQKGKKVRKKKKERKKERKEE